MNFIQFKDSLRDFTVFSIADIRAAYGGFDLRRLSEWQKKGYIQKIIKGYYLFSDAEINEDVLAAIANKLYKPSYISLETALSYYGLIPEGIYITTSVSTRRTYRFETPIATFTYRTIKPVLFFGYSLLSSGIKIAFMEKAILDFLYLNPSVRSEKDFFSLRLNKEEMLSRMNTDQLRDYVKRFNQKRLANTVERFLTWL